MKIGLAVIGGTGVYAIEGAKMLEEREIPTPFGLPSDTITIAEISGQGVAFLPRHGRGHRYLPGEVPSHANIWALKSLGVEQIVAVSAVGSLSEEFKPGDFVLCDQIVDRTTKRPGSFFGGGIAGHVPFAEPFCVGMREAMNAVFSRFKQPSHSAGTYVCMEGPMFSTRAESEIYRSWKAHLIGMTALPEAKLAREAEICYATIATVTDYDCWRVSEESVSVDMIMARSRGNTAAFQRMLPELVKSLSGRKDCGCRHAAAGAFMTDPAFIPYDVKRRLSLFYGKYWK